MAKSDRHTELQNMVVRWIRNRSFKMCGLPEFKAVGYIADFVAIAGMNSEQYKKYAGYSGLTTRYMVSKRTDKGWERQIFGDVGQTGK